jgi:hypothetical protein
LCATKGAGIISLHYALHKRKKFTALIPTSQAHNSIRVKRAGVKKQASGTHNQDILLLFRKEYT